MKDENSGYDKDATGKPLTLETRIGEEDGRRFSPSTGRNKDAVRDVFLNNMPITGCILEVASGTGEHGAHITEKATDLAWVYSDIDRQGMESQAAWAALATHNRLRGPIELNATSNDWGQAETLAPFDGVFNSNMIHIAPFEAAEGLIVGAGRLLTSDGKLMLYGPFARSGKIAPSNARFDEDLKRRDSSWGVRDLEQDIVPLAAGVGFDLQAVIEMPANNLSVIFTRR